MKEENENKQLITVKTKEKASHKFIEIIKKKWLINGTKTTILIAMILAMFFAINLVMQNLELTPIDLSQDQLFTLTEGSKDKVKNIEAEITMYFVEYAEDDTVLDLARQYKKVNDKISVELVKANDRPDLVEKYEIESGTPIIIVECGPKYKKLLQSDLYTQDYTTYETINVAEEKLTSAIQSVSTSIAPKVYFLTGYSNLSLDNGLQYLSVYLQNEVNEVQSFDILTTGKVPEDCNALVITMPSKDFDELATNAIIEYINNGGNILWFQAATAQKADTPNINKILAMYGINPFEGGIIRETDTSKMLSGSPDLILPNIYSTQITKKITSSQGGVILVNATKVNTVEDETLEELKVEKTTLLTTSENAYFRTNFNLTSDEPQEGEEKSEMTVGQLMTKTLVEANEETAEPAKTSKLIIYGETYFISDIPLSQNSMAPVVSFRQNKDLVLNSIAYLVDREEDITARKSTGSVTYTATETENNIILMIIFIVPLAIILAGIIVWMIRRRKK